MVCFFGKDQIPNLVSNQNTLFTHLYYFSLFESRKAATLNTEPKTLNRMGSPPRTRNSKL